MDTETKPLVHLTKSTEPPGSCKDQQVIKTIFSKPDKEFWDLYAELWHDSSCRSPFQSPSYLKDLSDYIDGQTIAFQFKKGELMIGAVVLQEDGKLFRFLSDVKSDYNTFVFRRDTQRYEIRKSIEGFLEVIKDEKISLLFNKHLEESSYNEELRDLLSNIDMFVRFVPYSLCPILECESPELLFQEMNRSKNVRYKRNRLLRMPNTHVEILTDKSNLEAWCDAYCSNHIKRWKDSPTPSKYTCLKEQAGIMRFLTAWAEDKTLVRFAIVQDGQRIALSAGLLSRDSFIGHLQSFDPAYKKHSLGNVLINLIGKWLMDQGIRKINFGDGKDNYKYSFATESIHLTKIYLSHNQNLPLRVRAYLDAKYRSNEQIRKAASLAKSKLKIGNIKLF